MRYIPFVSLLLALYMAPPALAASVKLAWEPCSDPKVTGYKIHYGTETGKYSKTIDINGRLETKATVPDLDDGKAYYFSVTAYYEDGNESGFSNEVSTDSGKKTVKTQAAKKESNNPPKASADTPREKAPPAKTLQEKAEGKIPPSRKINISPDDPRIPPSRKF